MNLTHNANYIMKNKTNLKMYRRQTPLLQQDIAYLLKIDNGQYNRIEKGNRPLTLDVILIFHLLGVSVNHLFSYELKALKDTISTQSQKLIEQLKTEQSPRINNRIAYLLSLVKHISKTENE